MTQLIQQIGNTILTTKMNNYEYALRVSLIVINFYIVHTLQDKIITENANVSTLTK